jgi:hypothetical protein
MANVNLDALIPREDFEVEATGSDTRSRNEIYITDLANDAFFYTALRKPDFQRETAEWAPDRVVGLIRTFITDDLIPGVILWKNKELMFVIDGSHRLSALIAWVHNDYGEGHTSQRFFGYDIPKEQARIAARTKALVEKEFGSYQSHKDAIANPEKYGPDVIARARRFGRLSLKIQWVEGDAGSAERSFVRINQQAAIIKPRELALISGRRRPNAIAARAIVRRGTGHQHWSRFGEVERTAIRDLATELHTMLFEPPLKYPLTTAEVPAGGQVYSATALPMTYDFINEATGVPSPEDDPTGKRTVEYLQRTKRVMQLLLSTHSSSLGLHPAVYFYSWTGKQQPILFLAIAKLIIGFERANRLVWFAGLRGGFEAFLISNRSLLNQVVRKFGTKDSGHTNLQRFYEVILAELAAGRADGQIIKALQKEHSYLQPEESPYDGGTPQKFSRQARSGLILRDLLPHVPKCALCGGLIPTQAVSGDHKHRREDGGLAVADNFQMTHPYCNTGYKEKKAHAARVGGH